MSLQQAAGCLIGGAPESPAQAGHPCSKLQSILVKTDVSFTILINDLQEKS